MMPTERTMTSPTPFGVRPKKGICANMASAWLAPMKVAGCATSRERTQQVQYTAPPAHPISRKETLPAATIEYGVGPPATPARLTIPSIVAKVTNALRNFSGRKRLSSGNARRPTVLAPWMGSCASVVPGPARLPMRVWKNSVASRNTKKNKMSAQNRRAFLPSILSMLASPVIEFPRRSFTTELFYRSLVRGVLAFSRFLKKSCGRVGRARGSRQPMGWSPVGQREGPGSCRDGPRRLAGK